MKQINILLDQNSHCSFICLLENNEASLPAALSSFSLTASK